MITFILLIFMLFRCSVSKSIQYTINNLCLTGGLIGLFMQLYLDYNKMIPEKFKHKWIYEKIIIIIATILHLILIFGSFKCNKLGNNFDAFIFGIVMYIASIILKIDTLYTYYGSPIWIVRLLPIPFYVLILYSNIINKISC